MENTFEERHKISPRRRLRTAVAFFAIWTISLLVLLFGLPIIVYQALTRPSDGQ